MVEDNTLLETIAAAMLDGITVSFTPVDTEGTGLATGIVVDAVAGGGHRGAAEIGFHELLLSGAADKVLSVAIDEATSSAVGPYEPIASAARSAASARSAPSPQSIASAQSAAAAAPTGAPDPTGTSTPIPSAGRPVGRVAVA